MLHLNVNGRERVVEEPLDSSIPLLWVLRDHLGLLTAAAPAFAAPVRCT